MTNIKKRFNILACVIVAVAMALSFLSFTAFSVKAEEADNYPLSVTVPDGQFNQSGSSVLNSSSSWTGEYVGDYSGSVISGIVDLSGSNTYKVFMDATKLDKYPEFSEKIPSTPFGKNTTDRKQKLYFPGTNTKALLINTNDTVDKRGTAYGYSSSTVELNANSFYQYEVWVKTGSFGQDEGAVIKLSGFDHDIGFWNIDTSEENGEKVDSFTDEMFGFRRYRIYVATGANTVSSVIKLQVGDSYAYGDVDDPDYANRSYVYPSNGYAFFDNVTLYELSANDFYLMTKNVNSDNVKVYDFNTSAEGGSHILTVDGKQIGDFSNGLDGWKRIFNENDGRSSVPAKYVGTYNAARTFSEDNIVGLHANPYTPRGNSENIDDKNILIIAAGDKATNAGVESGEITITHNKFYVLSIWANTQNFESGSSASIVVVGDSNIPSLDYKLSPVSIDDVSTNSNNKTRYGWSKYMFFVRGSTVKDCKIKLQLWLGYTSDSVGTVLFDEVRFEEVSYTYFNNNASSGTEVAFDSNPSYTLGNGKFFEAENYGESYPLKPAQWTEIGEVPEGAASGAILTNQTHFTQNASKYLGLENPIYQGHELQYNTFDYPSMLLLASDKPAYFGYTSSNVTIAGNSSYKLSVTLKTVNDAKASIWVTVDGTVITSLKDLSSESGFKTYELYVQGDTPFESGTGTDYTATLSISLGNDTTKSSGGVFVVEAGFETVDATVFDEKYTEFKQNRYNELNYDMYSFSKLDFFGYDRTDKNTIKRSTNWSIVDTADSGEDKYTAGVFDPHHKENSNGSIPTEITKAYDELDPESRFDNIYVLQVRDNAVTAQLINPIKFAANSYYLVTVTMAVVLKDDKNLDSSVGAGIYLSNEPYNEVRFDNIKTTDNLVNKYEFREYQFYVESNDSDNTVFLRVTLGDKTYLNQYVSGDIYIAYVNVTDLGSSDESMVETDLVKIINKHVDENADTDTDTDDDHDHEHEDENTTVPNDSEKWWLIPSILFGVAIVLAVVGSIIRAIVEKRSKRQRSKELNSYDRRLGYVGAPEDDNASFDDDVIESKPAKVAEQDIDAFNDDDDTTVKPVEEKPTEQTPAENATEPSTEKPAAEEKQKISSDVNDDFDE